MGQCLSVVNQILETANTVATPEANTAHSSSSSSPSPYYASLPAGAERYSVRNVYDGDTLTLTDQRRVRFLGVDTPELKEREPFSQEAKHYTSSHCSDSTIWLSYEPNHERKDHYGRLLAWVWVEATNTNSTDGQNYLCVNEGLIQQGLASAYTPSSNIHFHNWDKLLALQHRARNERRGMWKDSHNETVYKTANGSAFHKRDCEHLANVRHLTEMTKNQAMDKGLHACRTCY